MRSKKAVWVIIIIVILMIVAIFVSKWKVEHTLDSLKETLDAQYNEDFKIAWNSLEDTPMKTTYNATVKSNNTGITYNVDVKDGEPSPLNYEEENYNAEINAFIEQQNEAITSLANAKDQTLELKLLSKEAIVEEDALTIGQAVKEKFGFSTVEIETLEVNNDYFEELYTQVTEYYERSMLPTEAFNDYQPVVNNYTVK